MTQLNGKSHESSLSVPSSQDLSQWLVTKLSQALGLAVEEIDPSCDFSEYGLNSIEAVNLSGELEQLLNRRLPPTLLWDYPTIQSLAEYLSQQLQPEALLLEISEIPQEYYIFESLPEYIQLQQQQQQIKSLGLSNPFFKTQQGIPRDTIFIADRPLINYGTYNYLGMCGDQLVSEAAKEAIDRYGTTVAASRLISGENPLHQELETEIAQFLGTEASIVYVSGCITNITTIGHLFKQPDLIVYDANSHNSILQGAKLSGASLMAFPHNDIETLDEILSDRRNRYQKVLIVVEGVYSTDGDVANLPEFIALKKRHKTYLMVDEAHSIGVLGKTGRGIGELFHVNRKDVDLWMGTLSKSFASCGGYIAGSKGLIEYLKYTAPGFVFSVGLTPANAAASVAAIKLLQLEPHRVTQLQQNAETFLTLAKKRGLDTGLSEGSPVVPIIVGDGLKAIELSQRLFDLGINVPFMIYPAVPKDSARLRFFLTCCHTKEQIDYTIETLGQELEGL